MTEPLCAHALTPIEWTRGGLRISTDPARLDLDVIHRFLAGSYWAKNIPRLLVEKSIRNSVCFGIYTSAAQVGFAVGYIL